MPGDIAREKQDRLAGQLLAAESSLERLDRGCQDQRTELTALLSLLDTCGSAYARSDG